jgi:hypothetical protein
MFSLAVVGLAACGSSSTGGGVPTPTNPNTGSTTPLTTSTPGANGVPDLTNAVAIQLPNPSDFSGFEPILGTIFPPVVGDAQMELALEYARATGLFSVNSAAAMNSGAATPVGLIYGLEDSAGWTGVGQEILQLAYSDSQGNHNISSIADGSNGTLTVNLIFSDSALVTWISGSVDNSGKFTGALLYGLVPSSNPPCQPISVSCNSAEYSDCPDYINNQYYQAYAACMGFLSSMTQLGTFSQTFSNWVTVQ